MSRRLRVRVAVAAVMLTLVGMLVMLFTARAAASWLMTPPDHWSMRPEDVAACEADPATWSAATLNVAEAWAYDVHGQSANPAAPPLPATLVAELADGAVHTYNRPEGGRLDLRRRADAGPCAVAAISVRPPGRLWSVVGVSTAVGAGSGLLAVALMVLAYVTRPLERRIAALREAARGVGGSDFDPTPDPLDDELGEIRGALIGAHTRIEADAHALRERQQALERHLAEVAHDLRTPIASMLLALQEVDASSPADLDRAGLIRALSDAESMSALIDNLHQGTRLRQGFDLREERADLAEIVARLEVRFAALGRLSGVEVAAARPDEPVWVACSPALAERAVANLVHNAVRHGRVDGHVAIVLSAEAERFALRVVDDGPGLPVEARASLAHATFDPDPSRPRDGGLGTVITAEVARRAGWELRYEAGDPGLEVVIEGPVAS